MKKRILMIPAATAQGKGLFIGLRADKIKIIDGKRSYDTDAVIALSPLDNFANGRSALIPSTLMTG